MAPRPHGLTALDWRRALKGTQKQLGDIATIFVGMPTKQSQLNDYGPAGNVLTVRALEEFGIDVTQLVRVDLKSRDVDKYKARANDLVLTARSTSLRMAIVPEKMDGIVLNSTLVAIRSLPVLEPRLLAAYLKHPAGQAALEAVAQSGSLQLNFTVQAVSKLTVPVPPMETQRRMVEILEAADAAYESAGTAARLRHQLANEIVVDHLQEVATR